jgi:hypothetical protein
MTTDPNPKTSFINLIPPRKRLHVVDAPLVSLRECIINAKEEHRHLTLKTPGSEAFHSLAPVMVGASERQMLHHYGLKI